MAKIINRTAQTITLPTMHVIAPGATLETANDTLRVPENAALLGGLARSLQVEVIFDAEQLPDQPPATVSFEPNPAAVEQAAVDRALAIAKAKEEADQLAVQQAAEAASEETASKPAVAKK